ncbi:MAG: class I SAM-dependent methyltransferase [Spirochaetales bacterium]|nr:class I SAM-dependent methyltransferase [Spirochaetales bacterium]
MKDQSPCPLCSSNQTDEYYEDRKRPYRFCPQCALVFVPPSSHLSEEEEKKVYDLHENDPEDRGYRRFLSRLADPLSERVTPGSRGLDFGCGPGPALTAMLEERGYRMSLFDKYYRNDPEVLNTLYDFICTTEVVEHLRSPGKVFEELFNRLVPGGLLAVMTKLVIDKDAFSKWHYIQDPTHICFFSRETFEYIAGQFNGRCDFIGKDVIMIQKKREPGSLYN